MSDEQDMISALGDVANFELDAERGRRWIVLFPEDYEQYGRDVDGNIAIKVDIEQAGEVLGLAAQSIAALASEDADGDDVIRDLINELERELDE